MKPAAEQKNTDYTLEMPRLILFAFVDNEAVKKILVNLINNAIKYADKKVTVKLLPFGSDDAVFNIEVKNDGFTIPYELKEKIFEPFYRIKETEQQPGTGIGLSLSRSLAELHKGVLDLQKPINGLNVFKLTLPIHQDNEMSFQQNVPADVPQVMNDSAVFDPQKLVILLVEDNREIINFLLEELLRSYNILTAFNGQEALDILGKENVQLIISDIMMPVMDGIELCRRVKTDLQFSHIPVILLTAKNTMHAKITGLEVGADAYIEKPFSLEHLKAQITNLINNRTIIKEYFARSPLTHLKGIASTKADSTFLEELNKAIYNNITDMDLDVDALSKLMNMSRPTLYRKIKALSNLTPNELINLSRLKKAAELLGEGKYKMSEVASMVGYTLPSNFSRDFHKQFGVTPSAYISSL
jgi:DNA-binding response OmpR family regulator